jgi:DNA-binding MarR family transcriptional regulator
MPRRAQESLSYLDAPLDALLGQMSHVRILRVLSEWRTPVPASILAKMTHLDLSGVSRAVDRLSQLGVVRLIGIGRGRLVEMNSQHNFTPVLQALFKAERDQRQQLMSALHDVMGMLDPAPRAAWIEGPFSTRTDTAHDPLRIAILAGVRERFSLQAQVTKRLREVGERFDLTIDTVFRTRADIETMTAAELDMLRSASLLYGVIPLPTEDAALQKLEARTHADLDEQSRVQGHQIAKRLLADPRVVESARAWVAKRMPKASEAERHSLREWEEILTWPPHRLSAFLRDDGERATRLRQTNPFVGLELLETRGRLHGSER